MTDAGEVLIVGAGPVGLFAALALAQEGVSVTVIEGESHISNSPRAMVYFPVAMIALEKLGVLADIDKQGLRNQRVGQKFPDFNFYGRLSLGVLAGLTYDYQIHAGQNVVTRIALEHAQRSGVKVLFDHKLVSIRQQPDNVIATVETPEGLRTLQSRWLVGCDGARSTVRKELGINFEGHTWANRFVATNVYCDFEGLGFEPAGFICDPVHMAMIGVINEQGLWRLTYQEDASLPAETFMDRLPERYAYHVPAGVKYEIETAQPYAIHQRCATSLREGRVLLAGDAAHATNPMGGLGLTSGFWDSMILADVLAAVLRGKEEETILDRYSDERRRVFWEVASPTASENKRMMEEADPERRKQDCARVRAMVNDPLLTKQRMCLPFRVIGDVLRPDSRWKDANPLSAAGIGVREKAAIT